MKKMASILAAAALTLVAFTGNALAYFQDLELIRVVYQNNGSVETATDLGSIGSFTSLAPGGSIAVGGGASAFSLSDFSGADWSNLNVAYFVNNKTGAGDLWASGGETTLALKPSQWLGLKSQIGSVQTYYGTTLAAQADSPIGDKTNANSYFTKLDLNNASLAGLLADKLSAGNIEASLADLATVGYVDQKLYFWDTPGTVLTSVAVQGLTLRTLQDGSTLISNNAVPLPASVLLFGSGLLGLFGVRRKSA